MSMTIETGDFPLHPRARRRHDDAGMPLVWSTQCSFNARR